MALQTIAGPFSKQAAEDTARALGSQYWEMVRVLLIENAKCWLGIFQSDEPNEHFKLAKRRPDAKPAGI